MTPPVPGGAERPAAPPPRMRWWMHAAVFIASLALVGFQTWPLIADPAHLVARHHDPWLFDWVMLSAFRNALADPFALLQGAAFYPQGTSLAYSEPLLVPGAVAGPLFSASGDPILAYNLTLLFFWALSGWAMYATAYRLMGRHHAAAVSAIVFTICSYRMDYYLEFQMQIVFGIPLAFYFLVRWLEHQHTRYLAGLLLTMALQALSVWYYAIITAIGLSVVLIHYAALRWRGWQTRAAVIAVACVIGLGVVLVPLAEPYFQVRREIGIERDLFETGKHSADVLTYFETTASGLLYRLSPTRHSAEASLFLGFVTLMLGVASLGWFWRPVSAAKPRVWWVALWVGVLVSMVAICKFSRPPAQARELPALLALVGVGAWVLMLGSHLYEGWSRWRKGEDGRGLEDRDLVRVILAVALVAFLLSLGPYVQVGRQVVGQGPYAWLYPFALPLHAIRVASRFGVLVVLAGALLAGFGFKWLLEGRSALALRGATALVFVVLVAEYSVTTLAYERTSWKERPPVYRALERIGGPVTVAEVPMTAFKPETRRMLYALSHGHYLVNGFSGFAPPITRAMAEVMALDPPGIPNEDELWAARQRMLQSLHPAPHLIVHRGEMGARGVNEWARLPQLPWVRRIGTFGADDLYEVRERQAGVQIERLVSWSFVRDKVAVTFRIEAPPVPGIERRLEVAWNGDVLTSARLRGDVYEATLPIYGPLRRVDANRLTFTCRYTRSSIDPARARIGTTGVPAPVDLELVGSRYPGQGRIRVNGVDEMPPGGGHLVVVLGPSGEVAARAAFDLENRPGDSKAFVDFIRGAGPGTVVAVVTAGHLEARLDRHVGEGLMAIGAWPSPQRSGERARAIVGVRGAGVGTALDVSGESFARTSVGGSPADAAIVLERVEFRN